ncbi:peptidyl-prolyl cis-trans isomerase-like 4 [Lingula anatina]|uniref:Peptidyl-prolyl cis-trans isomerase n=1 Tax=Lingula anatina TaxID=7574 RepID=A0A1S3HZ13_LINAN|nr:peptidyl-prolyl cis-trans isomerase-like 4 [Lingula anatina]|eukprot:XP_013390811.1 peptidyl-prolyl cis-trans isomerase-like 4 [Lingula anatina]
MAVILETSVGDLTIDLYTEERPRSCLNFLKLCKIKYYNFSLFHSIQRNLVAQTGDPTGSGRGGAAIFEKLYGEQARFFEREVKPILKHKKMGTVSMVNNGNDMHGSQFFITTGDNLDYLDGVHTVFGEVSEGFDTLSKINEAHCDQENRPFQDIRILHTIILDDPYPDPPGLEIPERSPEPSREMLDSGRIGFDEEIDDTKGKSMAEIEEMMKEREAKANAQILEMVGDLPDVDVKPEDNVLFVCKLNPVTTGEDLEIIFSRFGNILSCEVIKDQKTGNSLQYAFIEFEKASECENAYFKMDNVLIDDRRIHVDFSQSVAKIKWRGKGKGVEHVNETRQKSPPTYVLKTQERKDNRYDFVYSDEEVEDSKKNKKHKKDKDRRSRSRERDRKQGKKSERKRSSSPSFRKDRQRDHRRQKDREWDRDTRERDRDDDRERREKDKDRDRDRRDRYRNEDRDRRDRESEKRRDKTYKKKDKSRAKYSESSDEDFKERDKFKRRDRSRSR